MELDYFNFSTFNAETYWDRVGFLNNWRKLGLQDHRWTPPPWSSQQLVRRWERVPALANQKPLLIYQQALIRKGKKDGSQLVPASFESPVGAAIVLQNQATRTAHLAWLHVVNDEEPLDRLLGAVMEALWGNRIERIVATTGLSPYLGNSVLLDHFDKEPPLHTPYNPPYYPELLQTSMKMTSQSSLYTLPGTANSQQAQMMAQQGPAQLGPFSPRQLGGRLLGLFQTAIGDLPFPQPQRDDVEFMLSQLGPWPRYGWVARINRQPVGFILLQADASQAQRRAKGGRNPLWRGWMQWRKARNFKAGRLLFGAVSPEWQGQGIGTQLLNQALVIAHDLGWKTLNVGPFSPDSPGSRFLTHHGGQPQQSYGLYEMDA